MRVRCGAICFIALFVAPSYREPNQEIGASKQLAPPPAYTYLLSDLSSTPMKMGRKSCIFIAGGEPGFMKALSILILNGNRQIERCFQSLGDM
jgi:hypothetical protein